MESLTKPVALNRDVAKVLDEIRAGADNALYGAGPGEAEELFAKHVVSLVEGAGLPVLQTMHYRWFLRELARLWRTRTGRDLAFHLELCIRKWVGLGLEPKTLQFLVCESYERLKGKDLTTKHALSEVEGTQRHEDVQPEPQNPGTPELSDRGRCGQPQSLTTKTPSHQDAEGGDMTGLSDNTDRVPSPEPASTTKTPSHQEEPDSSPAPNPQSLIPAQDPSIPSELS